MLQINYNQGRYELEGNLALENSISLLSYFETLLQYDSKIILNINKLKNIDSSGADVLAELYKKASQNNKVFKIFGKANDKVSEIIKTSKLKDIVIS